MCCALFLLTIAGACCIISNNTRSSQLIVAWAEKEYANLIRVNRSGIPCPAPLLQKGHVIVMSMIGSRPSDPNYAKHADSSVWSGLTIPAPQLRCASLSTAKEWWSAYVQVVAIMCGLYQWW